MPRPAIYETVYDTTLHFLDSRSPRITRDAFARLHLFVGDEEYEGVRLTCAFPHTDPTEFVSLADADGKEVGVIENLDSLDRASRKLVDEELELAYFAPKINQITKVGQHYGATSWHVQTDRGPQVVRVRERGDIRWLSASRVVLTDANGIRYEIQDTTALDDESRFLLEQES